MKKTLLVIASALVGTFAFAQKPTAGSKTAEVSFAGGAFSTWAYTVPELRFRYFMADNMAVRARLNIGSTSSTSETAGAIKVKTEINSGFMISLNPGVEMHFAGTDKLSPYYGAQLGFSFGTSGTTKVTNASSVGGAPTTGDSYEATTGSTMGLSLGGFMGCDYYVTDAVFVGGEFGLNLFSMTSVGEGETKVTAGGVAAPAAKTGTSGTFNLFGVTAGGIRLGFRF